MSTAQNIIKRPILTFVMNIILVLFGGIGFTFLGVRDYPAIDCQEVKILNSTWIVASTQQTSFSQ